MFDSETAIHLKPWLVRTLEPICDAEPGALADYILALLKHNAPENDMRKELTAQLDEFLEKECSAFIDALFTVIRTKSYLPYTANSPPAAYSSPKPPELDAGIPIPLDGLISPSNQSSLDRTRKRSIGEDERALRPPAKGPKISSDGQFSRYSNGSRSTGGWGPGHGDKQDINGHGAVDSENVSYSMNPANQIRNYRPPDHKRGICRDYHNNGYCARGAYCKYSHGDDAVIPSQIFPMPVSPLPAALSFMSMFPNGVLPFPMGMAAAATAYDPHEAQMDMRPHLGGLGAGSRPLNRAPLLPRVQGEGSSQVTQAQLGPGELPVIQDLTPNPALSNTPVSNNVPGLSSDASLSANPVSGQPLATTSTHIDPESADTGMPISQPMIGRYHTFGRGRGRGHFTGESHSFHGERRSDKTLVVEKIPEDKLSLDAVNGWFKRFGTVTNVAVDASNAKALVSFSKHEEAHAAWKSEDAVFNNRFVKIFWHRPMEGHGQVGARMLAASAPAVASMAAKESTTDLPVMPAQSVPLSTPLTPPAMSTPSSVSALAAKQRLLEQQITEQKSLMAKLSTSTPLERKEIMSRLRKLGEEMTPPTATVLITNPTASAPAASTNNQQEQRERLDRELEIHHATSAAQGDAGNSTEDLKAKLEKLKAEALKLGISDATGEPIHSGSYRPYRGRGRGARGYLRGTGRGAIPRSSMKLDNRPKTLLIRGVPSENVQVVRDWFETTGQVESLESFPNGDIIVTFRTRNAAEQGLSKGNRIPTLGKLAISWYLGPQPPDISPVAVKKYDSTEDRDVSTLPSPSNEILVSPQSTEEEVVTSGWGGDADDGDGMAML